MTRLVWDNDSSPKYRTGVSQGVFYGEDGVGFAWSGLISVTDRPQANEPTAVYNSLGQKYDLFGNVSEMKHGLTCYTYPEEMDEFLGMEYLDDFGFKAYERPPKKFHMAYRTELGNGLYEIHVLLNQIATFGDTARQTVSASPSLTTITMNLEGSLDPRFKSSHIVLDSRLPITQSAERLLFGDQYTDANIDDFLTAEPVWETIATNYAPTIEPDYDNYVWLGGENLVLGSPVQIKTTGYSIVEGGLYLGDTGIQTGEVVTLSMKADLGSDRTSFKLFNSGEDLLLTLINEADRGSDGVYRVTFEWKSETESGPVSNDYINLFHDPSDGSTASTVDWIKIERGSVASPWTPAPGDAGQLPRPFNRNPSNYKPGVKYGDVWNRDSTYTTVFYDELTKGLGVYSYKNTTHVPTVTASTSFRTLPVVELENSAVRGRADITLQTPLQEPMNQVFGRFRAGLLSPLSSTIPNQRGTHPTELFNESMTTVSSEYDFIRVYHGGSIDGGTFSVNNLMVSHASYTGEFFDANTKPKARGTRYQRIVTEYGEYTELQQLRLRTTSKVILSDVTYYDYWLEAADSMLLLQNETFTFNGPQAIIDGDTFTIDDSILGFEEG